LASLLFSSGQVANKMPKNPKKKKEKKREKMPTSKAFEKSEHVRLQRLNRGLCQGLQ